MIHLSELFLHQLSFLSIRECGLCYSHSKAAGLLTTGKKKTKNKKPCPTQLTQVVFMSFATKLQGNVQTWAGNPEHVFVPTQVLWLVMLHLQSQLRGNSALVQGPNPTCGAKAYGNL